MNLRATFDPLTDILVAQTSKPEGLKPLNFRTLNPFQRALMVIDGTVTKFIEAYTMLLWLPEQPRPCNSRSCS